MGAFNWRAGLAVGLTIAVVGGGTLAYRLTAEAKDSAKPAPKAAAPAEAPKDDKPAALWGKTCQAEPDGKQVCAVVQNVIVTDKNTNKSLRALTVAVGYLGADGKLRMLLTLPLGINLPPGVIFQIDEGKANTLPIETCVAEGCRVAMAIDESGRDSLTKSKMIRVTYQLANGQNLALPVQLAGFGDAIAQLAPP
jgi:invasion protein IalB